MKAKNDLTGFIIEAIRDKKGNDIVIIDLQDIEGATASEYVIASGRSTSQVSAIADNIRDVLLEKCKVKPYNYDGYRNCEWIVLDYGDIMVHIFLPDVRLRYDLEGLWSDGIITELPDEL